MSFQTFTFPNACFHFLLFAWQREGGKFDLSFACVKSGNVADMSCISNFQTNTPNESFISVSSYRDIPTEWKLTDANWYLLSIGD